MAINNIVFDMGRVLIRFDQNAVVLGAGVPEEDLELVLEELMNGTEWVLLDWGKISLEEAVASVCMRVPARLHEAIHRIVYGWWTYYCEHIPGMDELIRELKGKGYGIYLLSNAPVTVHEYLDKLPGADCFDGRLISADCHLLKPQPEIFEKLCIRFGLSPEECLFIDDNPANTAGAIVAGMQSIRFCGSCERLRTDLRNLQLL